MKTAEMKAMFVNVDEANACAAFAFTMLDKDEQFKYVDYDVKTDNIKNTVFIQVPCISFEYAMYAGAVFGHVLEYMNVTGGAPSGVTMAVHEMEVVV